MVLPFFGVGLLILTGMYVTGVLSFIGGIVLLLGAASRKKLSALGADHYAKWRAFRRFLLHFSEMERSTIPALEIWEHYLVYAVELGVAKQVMEQLMVYPQLKDHSFIAAWPGRAWLNNPARFSDVAAAMQCPSAPLSALLLPVPEWVRFFRRAAAAAAAGGAR